MAKKVIAIVGATGSQGGGLAQAILNDPNSEFTVRAITRDANSEAAKKLEEQGAEVVVANLDNQESMYQAFKGAYGVYCVTFYWEHFSPEKELHHILTMAEAAKKANIEHVIWSTLEDSRKWIPLDDDRMPTLLGKFKVPHLDVKGEADRFFIDGGLKTTFLVTSFYWDNFIKFDMGPKRGEEDTLELILPIADKRIAGIVADDIGNCAYGIFKEGPEKFAGKYVGVAGEHLSGNEIADIFTEVLGEKVIYKTVAPEMYRNLGFPGADDLGNMFQFFAEYEQIMLGVRDLENGKKLHGEMKSLKEWIAEHKDNLIAEKAIL